MSQPDCPIRPHAPRPQTVHWVIAALLAAVAAGLWLRPGQPVLPAAWAQAQPLAGARGVYAFPGQLDSSRYGLFMLDVDQGTIWCYEFVDVGGTRKLRLTAARTWIYDRYLQDFNCAPPDFRMVQQLVAEQRVQAESRRDATTDADGDPAGSPPRGDER